MYQNTENFVDKDFEQYVRRTAYHLWENDGRPTGRETEYWFKAIRVLMAERDSVGQVTESSKLDQK